MKGQGPEAFSARTVGGAESADLRTSVKINHEQAAGDSRIAHQDRRVTEQQATTVQRVDETAAARET